MTFEKEAPDCASSILGVREDVQATLIMIMTTLSMREAEDYLDWLENHGIRASSFPY
ncbi:hypothetical protein HY285_03180 [Candidatus Peregrinibacteria bacterium]|nr:hypothetical protein [Candidatus Peregrinibacteria bacterium]MBI3816519.1 hypothetical protein [Candidatus Peregrinibacteria bacterium]